MASMRALVASIGIGAALATFAVTARAGQAAEAEACASAAEESQSLRREGKLTHAREQLIVCARATCPAVIRKDCTVWLAEVERNLPSVVLRAVDAKGKDVTDVRVRVDGAVVAEKLDGRAVSVDPGEHVFVYETSGAAPVTEKVLVRQGETNRLLTVTFAPEARAQAAPAPAAQPAAPAPRKDRAAGIPTMSWILGGAGIVAGGVGTALWLSGTSDHASLESGCARTQSCSQSDVDSAQTKLLAGDVAVGVGLVAIGAAVVLALVSRDGSATAQAVLAHMSMAAPRP